MFVCDCGLVKLGLLNVMVVVVVVVVGGVCDCGLV